MNQKRFYWESRIANVVAEIEKFKLEEHMLQQEEERRKGNSNTAFMLSKEELDELKTTHATTNSVALNSKLDAAKKELDGVLFALEIMNAPHIKRIEDEYLLPPSPGLKDFQVGVKLELILVHISKMTFESKY